MKLVEIKDEHQYRLFVDLDGVMANFDKKALEILDPNYSAERFDANREYRNEMWKKMKIYHKKGGQFWYELDLLPDAMDLWNYVKRYNPTFLTATGSPTYKGEGQKNKWIDEKFGTDIKRIIVHKAADKAQYAKSNHILIDDKMKALNPWIAAGGIGVLHKNAASTISKLKLLGL